MISLFSICAIVLKMSNTQLQCSFTQLLRLPSTRLTQQEAMPSREYRGQFQTRASINKPLLSRTVFFFFVGRLFPILHYANLRTPTHYIPSHWIRSYPSSANQHRWSALMQLRRLQGKHRYPGTLQRSNADLRTLRQMPDTLSNKIPSFSYRLFLSVIFDSFFSLHVDPCAYVSSWDQECEMAHPCKHVFRRNLIQPQA